MKYLKDIESAKTAWSCGPALTGWAAAHPVQDHGVRDLMLCHGRFSAPLCTDEDTPGQP